MDDATYPTIAVEPVVDPIVPADAPAGFAAAQEGAYQQAVANPQPTQPERPQPAGYQAPLGTQQSTGYQPPAVHRQPPQQPSGYATPFAPNATDTAPVLPWYSKTWFVILMLLLFWPVGLVFMWMKSCTWSRSAKVVITSFIAALIIANIAATAVLAYSALDNLDEYESTVSSLDSNGDSSDESSKWDELEEIGSDAAALGAQGAIEAQGAQGDQRAVSSGSSSSASVGDKRLFDQAGTPSLYALCELTVSELFDALDDSGYEWLDNAHMWTAPAGGLVEVHGADGPMAKDDAARLGKLGVGAPVVFVVTAREYETPEEALTALAKDVVIKDRISTAGDDAVFAIVKGTGQDECLVAVTQSIDDEQTLLVFNEESAESGLFASLTGVDAGSSLDEIWNVIRNG